MAIALALVFALVGCSALRSGAPAPNKPASSDASATREPASSAVTLPPHAGPLSAPATSSASTVPTTPGGKLEAKIEKVRRSLDGSRVVDFAPGAYRGKNVIIIQVESLDDFVIGKKYGGKEITPNLNKLVKQSWYWPNMYSETGLGNTVDAEFIVNTSLCAPEGQATTVKYANRVLPGLPRLLKALGYYSFTIHQNKVLYWNRKQMYKGVGFDKYYDADFFHDVDTMGEFGSSDEQLFKRGVGVLRTLEASGTPFYSQFITLSSHGPFDTIPDSRLPLKPPAALSGSLIGNYIAEESYSDVAIGKFIASLKATSLWDNSIVVIYGDHTAMPSNTLTGKDALGAEKLLGRAYGPVDRQRIPLIVHLPGQTEPVRRTDVAGQIDIMPTVADLVGLDLTQVPHMGRSLFAGSSGLVPLNAYLPGDSFLSGSVLFMPGQGSDAGSNRDVTDDSAVKTTTADKVDLERVRTLKKLSDSWVLSLKTFNGGEQGWIPDPVARKAAKPYGFLQQGKGGG